MVNYANGKIYKMVNDFDDKIYVGGTCNELRIRKRGHVDRATRFPDRPVYQHLLPIGWNNVRMILIENYPCSSKYELNAREQYWIDELKPELNSCKTTETSEEYRIRKARKEGRREYYLINKEKYKKSEAKKLKDKEKITCPCGVVVSRKGTTRHKRSQAHIEWVNTTGYVEPVKQLIDHKVIVECDCGVSLKRDGMLRHTRSKQHKRWQDMYDFIYS